ncbi:MAG: 7,8-didemethyl-8-hydroxy-5-deazariboflavin synthase subunit CofG [bacterium]
MNIPGSDEFPLELDYTFAPDVYDCYRDIEPSDVEPEQEVSFCRNIFLPLTTACRYTCTYCTYFDVPGEATLMSREDLEQEFEQARETGCKEALFTFGDKPDDRYESIHETLDEWGYDNIIEYLYSACEWALDHGLLPHSNPGDLTYEVMKYLRKVNASMGVMLETTADVEAHSGPRIKQPAQRLRTLENAGKLKIPFTSGILVGIGENWDDRIHSLLCLRRLHREYEHLQEIIVQPVVPNERSDFSTPPADDVRKVVAMARTILPGDVEVQIPPNLYDASLVMDCGIGDLGGVSPVTDDYINPDYKWPAVRELEELAEECDFELVERGPVYERYLNGSDHSRWISDRVRKVYNHQ